MNITLKIDKKGSLAGTVGWLAEHAYAIRLSSCEPYFNGDYRRAAWLVDKEGKVLSFLFDSVRGRFDREGYCNGWTDAAVTVLEEIAAHAKHLLQEDEEDADLVEISLMVKPVE